MLRHLAHRPINGIGGDKRVQTSQETEKKVPLKPGSHVCQPCGWGRSPSVTPRSLSKTETATSNSRYREDAGKMLSTELNTQKHPREVRGHFAKEVSSKPDLGCGLSSPGREGQVDVP